MCLLKCANEVYGQFTLCQIIEVCCHTEGVVCTMNFSYRHGKDDGLCNDGPQDIEETAQQNEVLMTSVKEQASKTLSNVNMHCI